MEAISCSRKDAPAARSILGNWATSSVRATRITTAITAVSFAIIACFGCVPEAERHTATRPADESDTATRSSVRHKGSTCGDPVRAGCGERLLASVAWTPRCPLVVLILVLVAER